MPGGRIDILVAPDMRNFVSSLRTGLSPAVGAAGAIGASMGLALGGAAAFKEVIDIGNEFTTSLNTLKAVAGATADQMAKVSEKAKQLGNDVTLPGTSANDAAAAMAELAKGGFSVQQSMDAAKGSLQLAAAAQIDAAQAATIQSQALQAFGLGASEAARVADVLANTANASSAEITDVAYGLQSGAAVAHQFGLTVEDTATALGLFANSGIKGSDAGTLLKSALLALTDQGKPAQAAIKDLGLTVYDSQGKFTGLRNLFAQLETAAHKMTPEMYQAATSTLFGSDAMRLASVAAEKGAAGFDQMHDAMSKQGSAAEVAAAKMQGLPGAMQTVQNAAENLALEVYDLVKGPLEQFAKGAASSIGDTTPKIVSAFHGAADAAVTAGRAIAPLAKAVANLPTPILAATAALVLMRGTALGAALTTAATATTGALTRVATAAVAVATAQGRVAQVAGVGAVGLGRFGSAVSQLGTSLPVVGRMQQSFLDASTAATRFGRTQGTLAAGMTGLRAAATGAGTALNGAIGAIGGPWVLGIAAATVAVVGIISELRKAAAQQELLRSTTRQLAIEQRELGKAFQESRGAVDSNVMSNLTTQYQQVLDANAKLKESAPGAFSVFTGGWQDIKGWFHGVAEAGTDAVRAQEAAADRGKAVVDSFNELGLSVQELARETSGTDAQFQQLVDRLHNTSNGGQEAIAAAKQMRDEFLRLRQVAKDSTDGFFDLTDAVRVLSSESASAADRIDAMKRALDVLSGKPIALQEAMTKYNVTVRDTAKATAEAWDASQGFGAALIGAGGQVDTATENGKRLYDQLTQIRDATITAAEAGADMGPVLSQNELQFSQLANAAGLTTDQVTQMATQLGYLPKDIQILAQLKGADGVEQQLVVIEGLLRNNAEGVTIPTDALTADTKAKLTELGVKVEDVNGKPGVVKVSAPDLPAVMGKLDELIAKSLPDKTQIVKLEYDLSGYHLPESTRERLHENVDDIPIAPRAEGGIDGALPGQATIQAPRPGLIQWAEPETGGEAFIPLAPAKRSRSVDILSTVAGHFGFGLTKMADGGIAVTRAMDFLRGQSGKPYQYGGVGNPSWDCSGFISAAYALLKGLSPFTRWFTTESDFASLGFRSGLDPTGRGLSVGIYRGGGGQYSHMAGSLAGTPLESGSNGVRVGTGAQAASSGNLPLKFYLSSSEFNPPGSSAGGSSRSRSRTKTTEWDASNDLELESARISLNKAKSQRDEDLKDPKKSADDKRQAQIDVQRAELRVQELEQKKEQAATSGGPVPEAPPLTGDLTDDQIRLEELQLALNNAKADRDDTWADPEATDDDRRGADLDLQKAINALAAEQKKQREGTSSSDGSSSTSSVVDLFGDAAKAFVTGQLSDALNVIGLGGDIQGVTGAAIGIAADQAKKQQKQTAPVIGADDLAKQGPVVPGTPNWLEEMMKTLRIPAVIRDEGGPLPNNMAAINTSGETEWVLNGSQLRAAATSRPSTAPNIDASVRIDNLHTGMSAGEFHREWKMLQIDQRNRARAFTPRT